MSIGIKSEYLVLGALMKGRMHGYEIMKFLKKNLSFAWTLGTSQLYLLLGRLESRSLVEGKQIDQDRRPSKRVFSLTAKGKEFVIRWLEVPSLHVRDVRIEFVCKLFFIKMFSPKSGQILFNNQKRQ